MAGSERAETLSRRKERSSARAWTQFLNAYQKNPDRLYCFYEGKDDPLYYNPRIRWIVFDSRDANLYSIWCDGKDNALSLLALLDKKTKYKDSWTAFFVDRDYDPEPTANRRLYVTLYYSFENFYVTTSALHKILSDEFHIHANDEDGEHSSTITLFEHQLLQFNEAMQEIHAWICCQRQKAREESAGQQLNLRDHKPSTLFDVDLKQVKVKQTLEEFTSKYPGAYTITEDELTQHLVRFTTTDAAYHARGKYIIHFFQRFLRLLVEDRRQKDGKRTHFKNRGTVALTLSDNIVSELTQYADTPNCLHEFLSKLKTAKYPPILPLITE